MRDDDIRGEGTASLMAALLLWYRDEGVPPEEVARREGMPVGVVRRRTHDAARIARDLRDPADWSPPVTPLYGCRPFVRIERDGSEPECPHRGRIPAGSWLYCERCGASGRDHDARLERDLRSDPKPDPKPPARSERAATRRERRAIKRQRSAA